MTTVINPKPTPRSEHYWDEDGCCETCGFDGAEWHHWKHSTYEGRAMENARMPNCKEVLIEMDQ
jgi:hypothetical protein